MDGHFFNQPPEQPRKEVPVPHISQARFDEIAGLIGVPFMEAASEVLGSEYSNMFIAGVEDRQVYLDAIAQRVIPTDELVAEFEADQSDPRRALNTHPDEDPGKVVDDAQLFAEEQKLEDHPDVRSGYERRRE